MSNIIERNRHLLESHELSDIVFLFKKSDKEVPKKIYAHKFELAKGSSVFKMIFYELSPTVTELQIDDFSRESFMEMINFLYLDEINVTAENALGILKLSKEYKIDALEESYTNFITKDLDINNVCKLLENSLIHKNVFLQTVCVNFIEDNTVDVLHHTTLVDVNKKTLSVILDVNSKMCSTSPLIYFNAAVRWAKNQCNISGIELSAQNIREILGELFYLISFPSMDFENFVKCLDEDKIFSNDEIGKIFLYIQLKKKREMKFKFQQNCSPVDTSIMFQLENYMNSFINRNTECIIRLSVNKSIFLHELFADRNPSGSVTIVREKKPGQTDEKKYIFVGNMITGTLKIIPAIKIKPYETYMIMMKPTTETAGSIIRNKKYYMNDLIIETFGSPTDDVPWRSPINKMSISIWNFTTD